MNESQILILVLGFKKTNLILDYMMMKVYGEEMV